MKSKALMMLHDGTHRMPGVPAHDDARIVAAGHTPRPHDRQKNRTTRHEAPPRVLVGWQNWIASLGRKEG